MQVSFRHSPPYRRKLFSPDEARRVAEAREIRDLELGGREFHRGRADEDRSESESERPLAEASPVQFG